MKIDRNGMRPCNRCLKLRAGLIDTVGRLLPGVVPAFIDMEVEFRLSPERTEPERALVRMRNDTGAVVQIEPETPFLRKLLLGKHVIFERQPTVKTARLKDRVSLQYYPVTVTASKITSDKGETLSPVDE